MHQTAVSMTTTDRILLIVLKTNDCCTRPHHEPASVSAFQRRRNAGMDMKRVVVRIGRLVLKGFRHEDQYAIATGIERVFADRDAVSLSGCGDVARLQVGGVHIEQGSKPQRIGRVAHGVGREIRK